MIVDDESQARQREAQEKKRQAAAKVRKKGTRKNDGLIEVVVDDC